MPSISAMKMLTIAAACLLFAAGSAHGLPFPTVPSPAPNSAIYTSSNGSTFSCCPVVCFEHCICCELTAVKPSEATPEMIKRQEALNLTFTYAGEPSNEALTFTEAKPSNEALTEAAPTFTEAKPSNEALTFTEAKPTEALKTDCYNCFMTCCCCLGGPIEPGTVDPELIKTWAAGNLTLTQSNEALTQSGGHRRMLIA